MYDFAIIPASIRLVLLLEIRTNVRGGNFGHSTVIQHRYAIVITVIGPVIAHGSFQHTAWAFQPLPYLSLYLLPAIQFTIACFR